MYNNYRKFLKNNNIEEVSKIPFKSNKNYCGILEHVSYNLGKKYLALILNEFPTLNVSKISNFCELNDKYGDPIKESFKINNDLLVCSPTSLRYIYHSLIILKYYSSTNCKNIVEVGCGYGGLCLAINYFIDEFDIKIDNYHIIDLPEPCVLIKNYIELHKSNIKFNIDYHINDSYGHDINNEYLFFISNYCYTEISKQDHGKYTEVLLPKVNRGFLTWQNGGNKGAYPIKNCGDIIGKPILKIEEEKPQTDAGHGIYKNYFVYF